MKESNTVRLSVTASSDETFTGEVCLELIQTLRVLEGRREVWLAKVAGSTRRVVAKKFLPGSKQDKESQREIRGLQELGERRLRCPRLIFTAKDDESGLWVVTDYIENSKELSDLVLHCMDKELRRRVIREFFVSLIEHWRAGVHQTDAHTRNFLWDGRFIYTIDVGSIRFKDAALPNSRKVAILEEMLGGFTVSFRDELLNVIPEVCEEFDEKELLRRIQGERFKRRVALAEKQNLKRIWRKSQRDCSQFLTAKHGRRKLICQRTLDSALVETLKNAPEELMLMGTRLKSGNTCTVQRIEWGGRPMVLKRYNPKSIFYRIRHSMMLSRAMRSWTNGIVMCSFGIPTVRPAAVVEEYRYGLLERAYFLMEHFEGESVSDYLNRKEGDEPEFERVVTSLSQLFARLRHLRIVHGDFKAKNILINESELRLIDVDGLRFFVSPRSFSKLFFADFQRFLKNWPDGARVKEILKNRLSAIFDQ
jgi:tRNA A-37 threonylcarbamoyl transferase component Bud32